MSSKKKKSSKKVKIPQEVKYDPNITLLSKVIEKKLQDENHPDYRFINVKLKNPYFIRVHKIYYTDDVTDDPRFKKHEMIHDYAIKFFTSETNFQHKCTLGDYKDDEAPEDSCGCDGYSIYMTGVGNTIEKALDMCMKEFYQYAKCVECHACYKIDDDLFDEKHMKCFSCILNSYPVSEKEDNDLCPICQTKNAGIYKSLGCCASKYHLKCIEQLYKESPGTCLKCPTCRDIHRNFHMFMGRYIYSLECHDHEYD